MFRLILIDAMQVIFKFRAEGPEGCAGSSIELHRKDLVKSNSQSSNTPGLKPQRCSWKDILMHMKSPKHFVLEMLLKKANLPQIGTLSVRGMDCCAFS